MIEVEHRIYERVNALRGFMRNDYMHDLSRADIQNTLTKAERRFENICMFIRSQGMHPGQSQWLSKLMLELVEAKFWGHGNWSRATYSTVQTWAIIMCIKYDMLDTCWEIYVDSQDDVKLTMLPLLPEHLQSAVQLMQ